MQALSAQEGAQRFRLALELVFGERRRQVFRKWKRIARVRVSVFVAGDDVGVKVRQRVPSEYVVHLQWSVDRLYRTASREDVAPETRRLVVSQFCWFDDMAPSPDDDHITALNARPLQVGICEATREHANAKRIVIGPPLLAHRTAVATPNFVERPRPGHGWRLYLGEDASPYVGKTSEARRSRSRSVSPSGEKTGARCGKGTSFFPGMTLLARRRSTPAKRSETLLALSPSGRKATRRSPQSGSVAPFGPEIPLS